MVPASTQSLQQPVFHKSFFNCVWQEWPTAKAGMPTDTLHVKTVHWNRALCFKMRWDGVWRQVLPVDEPVSTDTPADRQEVRMGKVQIVQVMHSRGLFSLVSHIVVPMHRLSTLSREWKKQKQNKNTSSSCAVRGKQQGYCYAYKSPTVGGRQLLLSAGVNDSDVWNKAKRATGCPRLVNKKMRVNKNKRK